MNAQRSFQQFLRHRAFSDWAIPPSAVYLNYLAAIKKRDIGEVLEHLTEKYGSQLKAMQKERDFNVFFDLWCRSEDVHTEILKCRILERFALIEVLRAGSLTRVGLIFEQGVWRISRIA